MATFVMTDAGIYVDAYNLSGDHNSLTLEHASELQDDTVFGDTTRSRKGGLKTVNLSASGVWNSGNSEPDEVYDTNMAVAGKVITVAGDGDDAGDISYFFKSIQGSYSPIPGIEVGSLLTFDVSAEATGSLVRGTIMQPALAVTASGTATARQLGSVASGQKVYAALHVVAASGTSPTLDVVVQSDDASGMASPVSRITFAQATAKTSEMLSADGPITDSWWRVSYTIGGTSPSFTFLVSVGIL